MNIRGFEVDTTVIGIEEAHDYLDTFGSRHSHRRLQAWFNHCARIRKDPNHISPDWHCDPRVANRNKAG